LTGDYFLPADAHADAIVQAIKFDRVFDVEVYDVIRKYIIPGTAALDVGSNFGQMAVLMSRLVGSSGIVHAFEADDFVFELLKKNVAANASNIIAHFGAVHHTGGEVLFFPVQDFERFGTYGSYGIDYVGGRGRPVVSLAIDEIEFSLPVSFLKVDVQGGDLFALKGAVETINRYRMPILFEYESLFEDELRLCFQDYVDFVQAIDYRFVSVVNKTNYLILPSEGRSG